MLLPAREINHSLAIRVNRRNLPPLNALRAFEAAARHMSFKDAAEELCVTATAVSHQIRHLENLIGMRLFQRTPRSLTMTEAGAKLYPVLKDSFDRLSEVIEHLDVRGQTLTVSCTRAFASKMLIPSLNQLHAARPPFRLNIHATDRLVDLLKGEADVAIRYGMGDYRQYASSALVHDRYIAVASPAWLARRPAPLSLHDLQASDLLSYHWTNPQLPAPTWERWMGAQGLGGFKLENSMVFNEESHALQAAIDGAGVVLASDVLVSVDLKEKRLVRVHDFALDGSAFHVVHARDSAKRESIDFFNAWITDLLRQMPR